MFTVFGTFQRSGGWESQEPREAMGAMKLWKALTRRKAIQGDSSGGGEGLRRVLSTLDLTFLGVGSTLGVGVYVLAGFVSRDDAGPSVVLSFLVAAIASMLAGLCYAEFGARVPRAGSAYAYSYVTMGEFCAFFIGWNLILEYIIGAASVVRALSSYVDALAGGEIQNYLSAAMPMHVSYLSEYPDFFAFGLCMIFTVALALGAKESSTMNNVFTAINLGVVTFVIISGILKADVANWQVDPDDPAIPADAHVGAGGFFPFGVAGTIKGAATCFYAFIGFDCIATSGEEAKDPKRSIPIAIIGALFIVFLAYFGVSAVLTLMWPYYLQDRTTPLPYVYEQVGWAIPKWIVSIGAVFGLFASLMGALYPLPRVIYAMASDGMLFQWLGHIHPRTQTPAVATIVSGTFTALMALVFNLDQLANMMAIGTLLAYSIVAACVLLLRYSVEEAVAGPSETTGALEGPPAVPGPPKGSEGPPPKGVVGHLVNRPALPHSTAASATVVAWSTTCYGASGFGLAACVVFGMDGLREGHALSLVFCVLCACIMALCVIFIALQPTNKQPLVFKVPLVPFIPAISITINIFLMMMLDSATWIRFAFWILIGIIIYFSYSMWHSSERPTKKPALASIYGGTDHQASQVNLKTKAVH